MTKTIAIVTGAAGDIGRAIAARLGEDHDCVLLVDIDGGAAEKVARALGPEGRFVALGCDVTDVTSDAGDGGPRGRAWAGHDPGQQCRCCPAPSVCMTRRPDIWRQDLALNLEAAFLCFRAVEAALKATSGSVINIASVNGLQVFGHPAYSAAKAGAYHISPGWSRWNMASSASAPMRWHRARCAPRPGKGGRLPIPMSSRRRGAGIPCSASSIPPMSPMPSAFSPVRLAAPSPVSACLSIAG